MYPCPHKVNYVMYARIHELWLYNPSNFAIQFINTKFLSKNALKTQRNLSNFNFPYHSIPFHSQGEVHDFQGRCKKSRRRCKTISGEVSTSPPLLRGWVSCTPVFPTGECWQVGLGLVPNWFLHFSCAPWSDMRWLISYKVVARGAFRKPSTRPGWAAFTHLSFGSPSCSFNFI
jgi:hypothetical protein